MAAGSLGQLSHTNTMTSKPQRRQPSTQPHTRRGPQEGVAALTARRQEGGCRFCVFGSTSRGASSRQVAPLTLFSALGTGLAVPQEPRHAMHAPQQPHVPPLPPRPRQPTCSGTAAAQVRTTPPRLQRPAHPTQCTSQPCGCSICWTQEGSPGGTSPHTHRQPP
jgi:hypothetical protein